MNLIKNLLKGMTLRIELMGHDPYTNVIE